MNQFTRLELLIGKDNLNKLKSSTILILGLGGVGSYVFEALVRSGVGHLILVDYDVIDITNLNRQLMTDLSNVGQKKTDILEKRAKNINKDIKITKIDSFITSENINTLFDFNLTYFIDCCDTVKTKQEVIINCIEKNIPFITCMGTGNKLDPSKLEILDLTMTSYDPLAKKIRIWAKKEHIKGNITCLTSKENPIKRNNDNNIIGSSAFVPSSAGLLIASYVVKEIITKNK